MDGNDGNSDHGGGGHFGFGSKSLASHDPAAAVHHEVHSCVMMSYCHGGRGGGGHSYGLTIAESHGPHGEHHAPGALSRQAGRKQLWKPVDQSKEHEEPDLENARTFIVRVANHGRIELMSVFERLAAHYDLIRLDDRRANFDTVDEIVWKLPEDPDDPDELPNLTGCTRVKRQYWQIGKRARFFDRPVWDSKAMTFIEFYSREKHFYETADYGTKAILSVVSVPVLDHRDKSWAARKRAFHRHQKAAREMAEALFAELQSTPPSEASMLLRKYYAAQISAPPVGGNQPSDGIFPATREEEASLRREDARREQRREREAGRNASTPGGSPSPKKDDGGEDTNTVSVKIPPD